MGSKRRYSALSASLAAGCAAVEAAMQAARVPVWQAAGVRADDRPARAHFTLARPARRATERDRAAGMRWASALDLSAVELCLDRVALYTWAEDRRTRQFRVVTELALTPPPAPAPPP
jgi:hypothetical protein